MMAVLYSVWPTRCVDPGLRELMVDPAVFHSGYMLTCSTLIMVSDGTSWTLSTQYSLPPSDVFADFTELSRC